MPFLAGAVGAPRMAAPSTVGVWAPLLPAMLLSCAASVIRDRRMHRPAVVRAITCHGMAAAGRANPQRVCARAHTWHANGVAHMLAVRWRALHTGGGLGWGVGPCATRATAPTLPHHWGVLELEISSCILSAAGGALTAPYLELLLRTGALWFSLTVRVLFAIQLGERAPYCYSLELLR